MYKYTCRWKVHGWYCGIDGKPHSLPDHIVYDEDSQRAIDRACRDTWKIYSSAEWSQLPRITPYDANNEDGYYGFKGAIPCDWPAGLSDKAKVALEYLDGTAYLFKYMGNFVVTDEGGWLTPYKKGGEIAFPRKILSSIDELEPWLEAVYDNALKNGWCK